MADDYPVMTVSARQAQSALLCAVGSEVELVDTKTINSRLQPGCYLCLVLTRFPIGV